MKNKLLVGLTALLCLTGCQTTTSKISIDIDEVGYQWEDTDAPVIREKGAVSFDVIAPKKCTS